jgi:hypothetical protein
MTKNGYNRNCIAQIYPGRNRSCEAPSASAVERAPVKIPRPFDRQAVKNHMNQNYLPPLLRGIGTTALLFATVFSVIVARGNVRTEQTQREALHAQAEAKAKGQAVEARELAELKVEVEDLRHTAQEESIAEEVIENPWFAWIGFLGTAILASSFFTEAYLRRRETT